MEYVSTDRLILDLTHQGRFDENSELCCILDSCIEKPVRHQGDDLLNPKDNPGGICTYIPDPMDLEYIHTFF